MKGYKDKAWLRASLTWHKNFWDCNHQLFGRFGTITRIGGFPNHHHHTPTISMPTLFWQKHSWKASHTSQSLSKKVMRKSCKSHRKRVSTALSWVNFCFFLNPLVRWICADIPPSPLPQSHNWYRGDLGEMTQKIGFSIAPRSDPDLPRRKLGWT